MDEEIIFDDDSNDYRDPIVSIIKSDRYNFDDYD